MGSSVNVKDQIDTEEIEAVALLLTSYQSEVEEDINKINSAVNYLTDEGNIGGDVATEFHETVKKIKPVLDRLQGKMDKFGELCRTVAESFDANASKTSFHLRKLVTSWLLLSLRSTALLRSRLLGK